MQQKYFNARLQNRKNVVKYCNIAAKNPPLEVLQCNIVII